MKEKRVVAGTVVRRPDQKASRSATHKQLHGIVLGQVAMKPGKDGIWIDAVIQMSQEVTKDETLLSSSMSSDPQPAISEVVVDKEDVSLLKGELVGVRHLCVRQDGHHSSPIIDWLWGWYWIHEPLMLEQVTLEGVVANLKQTRITLEQSNMDD